MFSVLIYSCLGSLFFVNCILLNDLAVRLLPLFILLLYLLIGCTSSKVVREQKSIREFQDYQESSKVLKVYTQEGSLYVLDSWFFNDEAKRVDASGVEFDLNRKLKKKYKNEGTGLAVPQTVFIPYESIAILETNRLEGHAGNLAAVTIPGIAFSAITIHCIINPKACFGSCPTFYAHVDGEWKLMAEGFSSSVLPVFEEKDVDHLYSADQHELDTFSLKVTNEALETHVIKYVDLLAVPTNENEAVYRNQYGDFCVTSGNILPISCKPDKDSCLTKLMHYDYNERYIECDSKNLAKKEVLEFQFKVDSPSQLGLIISSRQTFLTTYLFYQGMAYSGSAYGHYAASIQNGNKFLKKRFEKVWDVLGGIEVFLKNKNGFWEKIDEISEMGPIASDIHLIQLPDNIKPGLVDIKLKMTQGLWRLDHINLAHIKGTVDPIRIRPEEVLFGSVPDLKARNNLQDTLVNLVTLPGDSYELRYPLLSGITYEYFIESKGYYLEWMRDEWMEEEDLNKLKLLFAFPRLYLRKSAEGFKQVEPEMEESFWNSRYESK